MASWLLHGEQHFIITVRNTYFIISIHTAIKPGWATGIDNVRLILKIKKGR